MNTIDNVAAAIFAADTHWLSYQNTYADPSTVTYAQLTDGWQAHYRRMAEAALAVTA